jgi:HEAT repeat protein
VPSDPDYHKKLCDLLQDPSRADRAIDVLIHVQPEDIQDKNVRQKIARNFRELALEGRSHNSEKVIQGLVLYGGKFSIPILIDLLDRAELRAPHAVFDGLAEFQDPKAAEALGRQLGDFFNHDAAVAALRKMGPVAEDVLIKSAPSNDAKVSLAAVKLLGEVGTPRSLNVLGKALKSKNPLIVAAAKQSAKDVRDRSRKPVRQDGKEAPLRLER